MLPKRVVHWWKWDGKFFRCTSVPDPQEPAVGDQLDIYNSAPGFESALLQLRLRVEGNVIKPLDSSVRTAHIRHPDIKKKD